MDSSTQTQEYLEEVFEIRDWLQFGDILHLCPNLQLQALVRGVEYLLIDDHTDTYYHGRRTTIRLDYYS